MKFIQHSLLINVKTKGALHSSRAANCYIPLHLLLTKWTLGPRQKAGSLLQQKLVNWKLINQGTDNRCT
jgi:hypothetical protein